MRPRAAALAFALITFALAPLAHAASRVVLLRGSRDDALIRQAETLLAGELRAAGFEVLQADRSPDRDVRAEFEAVSARLQPVMAALAILPASDDAVELWLSDRVTGKLVIRRIDIPGGRRDGAAADIAVRAVELLRGSLLEVTVERPRAAPGEKAVVAPADVARWVEETAPDRPAYFAQGLGVSVGATVLAGTSTSPSFAPLIAVFWGGSRGLAVRLALVAPGVPFDVSRVEGEAHIRQELLLLEGLYVFRPRADLQPFVAASAGGYLLHVQGTAASFFKGAAGSTAALALGAGGGVAARLGKHLSLLLDARAIVLEPPTSITIVGQEVARAGGVSLLAALGVTGSF